MAVRLQIAQRLDRLVAGNLGDVKSVGDGVNEMRIFAGPGYRLYFTIRNGELIILFPWMHPAQGRLAGYPPDFPSDPESIKQELPGRGTGRGEAYPAYCLPAEFRIDSGTSLRFDTFLLSM